MSALPATLAAGATRTITFDGGVVRPATTGITLAQNLTAGYVTNNGARIDTNGLNATVAQALVNGTAAGTNGTLRKLGSGTLTLSASNSFTGSTRVEAGTLTLTNANALAGSTLDLDGADAGAVAFGVAGTTTYNLGGLSGSRALTTGGTVRLSVGGNGQDATYDGNLTAGGAFTKVGAGRLTLSGSSSIAGVSAVDQGSFLVDGSLAPSSPVTIASGATVGGSGTILGALTGSGLVSPGNSPGILTATQFDPSGGLDAAFEFTTLSPAYASPTTSLNDVLRLTNGANPFASGTFAAGNVVDIYFNVDSITGGGVFEGGFFTGLSAEDLLTSLNGRATFNYWAKTDGAGDRTFDGVNYVTLSGVTLQTTYGTRDFGGSVGNVTGSVTQFVIAVPEPAAVALAGIGVGIAGWAAARRRYRQKHG
ncbi:MAG: autotransporter-associated beta strand repeat-containing protein [Pirellulales bacterium]